MEVALAQRDRRNLEARDAEGVLVSETVGEREEARGEHDGALLEAARVLALPGADRRGRRAQVDQHAHARRNRAAPLDRREPSRSGETLPRDGAHAVAGPVLADAEEVVRPARLAGQAVAAVSARGHAREDLGTERRDLGMDEHFAGLAEAEHLAHQSERKGGRHLELAQAQASAARRAVDGLAVELLARTDVQDPRGARELERQWPAAGARGYAEESTRTDRVARLEHPLVDPQVVRGHQPRGVRDLIAHQERFADPPPARLDPQRADGHHHEPRDRARREHRRQQEAEHPDEEVVRPPPRREPDRDDHEDVDQPRRRQAGASLRSWERAGHSEHCGSVAARGEASRCFRREVVRFRGRPREGRRAVRRCASRRGSPA